MTKDEKRRYQREWWIKNGQKIKQNYKREYDRKYKVRARKNGLVGATDYRQKNSEKVKAHDALNHAVKSGKVKRLPCEICGEKRKYRVHAHHDNYAKPLEVRWLCVVHHKEIHK